MRSALGGLRRYRVAVRPKVRRRQAARLGAVAAVAALVLAGALGLRRLAAPDAAWRAWRPRVPAPAPLKIRSVAVEGAPDSLKAALERELGDPVAQDWGPIEPYRAAERLKSRFPCLASVRVRRSWADHSAVFEAALRRPVARVVKAGRPAGWLDETGEVFDAPEGTYPDGRLPAVEAGADGARSAPALAELVRAASREGALPSPLRRLSRRPAADAPRAGDEVWEAELEDGTRVVWGGLDWVEDKLSRLREVLADAKGRFSGVLTADLRWFGDGRIVVRGSAAAPVH